MQDACRDAPRASPLRRLSLPLLISPPSDVSDGRRGLQLPVSPPRMSPREQSTSSDAAAVRDRLPW